MARGKKSGLIIGIVVIVLIAAAAAVFFLTADARAYGSAKQLEERGAYREAIEAYRALAGYQDADERIDACTFQLAVKMESEADYAGAQKIFDELGDYGEAAEHSLACRYGIAADLLAAEKYDEAYALYSGMTGYRDVSSILSQNRGLVFAADRQDKLDAFGRTGSIVRLGRIEQDNETENGLEQIEWIVVDTNGDKSLLVSRYAVAYLPFSDAHRDMNWANSVIRKWLNNDFINDAFTSGERGVIETTKVKSDETQSNSRTGTKQTEDRVFLLSAAQVKQYFPGAGRAVCEPTAAVRQAELDRVPGLSHAANWWLRTSSLSLKSAEIVEANGSVSSFEVDGYGGVRPAMWIDAKKAGALVKWDQAAYSRAEEQMQSGNYAKAADDFGRAGECLDAMERWKECHYLLGRELLARGEMEAAYTALCRARDWSDARQLLKEDAALREIGLAKRFAVGRTLLLGSYKQSGKWVAGKYIFPAERIEWTVLDYQDGKALVIASRVIDHRPFGNEKDTWAASSLRRWLNGQFMETAFSEEERAAILTTTVDNSAAQINPKNQEQAAGSEATEDRLYLLSYAELMRYFPDEKAADAALTDYVRYGGSSARMNDKAIVEKNTYAWWLRTPANDKLSNMDAYNVRSQRIIDEWKSTHQAKGVRPIMWVDVTSPVFAR